MANFALFPDLPLEIQDKVWEAAIPLPAPTAFHAQLARQPLGRAEDGSIDRYNVKDKVLLYRLPTTTDSESDLQDRDCVMATLSSMLVTCRRSYHVAVRAYKALVKPASPFLLRGQDSLDSYCMEVDAARDLVILSTGWQWPCRLISTSSVFRLQVPTPLHYLGLSWPGPSRPGITDGRSAFYYSEALNGLLALWGSLRALYVVVDPAHLREAERPWPAPAHRQWSSTSSNNTILEDYLASYESDPCDETPEFQSGGRRYHEVTAAQVARSGGLGEVVELLESARRRLAPTAPGAQNQGQQFIQATEREPARCRIMTWRCE